VVEEFDSPAFRAALRQTVRKWRPAIAQLEFTQMAQYARDCAPAKTILVEHDITCDLFEQLARRHPDWDTLRQLERWRRFETGAWRQVDRVAVMSERDRRSAAGARAFVVPNGVDLERFRPSALEPDPRQLLFVGSFAHLPNLLGLAWFLEKVWPGLAPAPPRLRVVAGERHQYYLSRHAGFVKLPLPCAGVEIDGLVLDVGEAYRQAAIVLAPLVASAGTSIKILEAMAMGKAVVATPVAIRGLELVPGEDLAVAHSPAAMAREILELIRHPERRRRLGRNARRRVEMRYGWDAAAKLQRKLYSNLGA